MWRFWIDRGGTFTDCIGLSPKGALHFAKVLSTARAPLTGIRQILGIATDSPIPPCEVRLGTTVATNALLERKGANVGLLITRGFGDLPQIGHQARPEIFALRIQKPKALYRAVVQVDARIGPDGAVVETPDFVAVEAELKVLRAQVDSLAIVVMHAYANPALELELAKVAQNAGFEAVSLSHQVTRELGLVGRGDTTLVDAYLTPLLTAYLRSLQLELPGSRLALMQSSGQLTDAAHFRGPNAILSGPAGGAVGVRYVAEKAGFSAAIGLDMGGTSTDVCRFDGELEQRYENEIAGVRLRAPMLAIHTVAAGGGSICRFDGDRLQVGPQSAGAQPGPLCYGNQSSTELTLADVNFALGRLRGENFPFPLQSARVQQKLEALAQSLSTPDRPWTLESVAEGFLEVAHAHLAEAVRQVSVTRGYDVRQYPLVVFGGAGGQHACALARRLGIRSVLLHPLAGVLSALGMGLASQGWHGVRDAGRVLWSERCLDGLEGLYSALLAEGQAQFGPGRITRRLDLRYRGTEAPLTVLASADAASAFEALHQVRFGYARPGHPIEVVAIRVTLTQTSPTPPLENLAHPEIVAPQSGLLWIDGWQEVPLFTRHNLPARVEGPALLLEATGTVVIEPGFLLTQGPEGILCLTDQARPKATSTATEKDPVLLEIYNHRFMSIAEEMGVVLQRTALSVNIRERLDFSCAVFDADGGLVANAPHIPVHLGAMSESILGVLARHPNPEPGDVFAINDPHAGGSHLPDLTVITPVFRNQKRVFFTASRGHHADIGGITPGSMPPFSRSLAEEGIVFSAVKIVHRGHFDEAGVRALLASGPWPAREPDLNVADIIAQIAANAAGAARLLELLEQQGPQVPAYMRHVQDNARYLVERALERLPDGERTFVDALDEGAVIQVRISKQGTKLTVDFTGTSAELDGNLNAPPAVTVAALIYVLRCLVGAPIPLNRGCLEPVTLVLPEGSLLWPSPNRAVCGGNVETSQRIVDVLLGALNLAAASQGTMNNLTFGNARFGYYETIAGGAGATLGHKGASAVHTHMTNTRITDPEVLESRFPVRLLKFEIRSNSGGRGQWPGGDGVVRTLRFLEPMRVSILSERRVRAPFGLAGGASGAPGQNSVNGAPVAAKGSFALAAGDTIEIATPGGGGWGSLPKS